MKTDSGDLGGQKQPGSDAEEASDQPKPPGLLDALAPPPRRKAHRDDTRDREPNEEADPASNRRCRRGERDHDPTASRKAVNDADSKRRIACMSVCQPDLSATDG